MVAWKEKRYTSPAFPVWEGRSRKKRWLLNEKMKEKEDEERRQQKEKEEEEERGTVVTKVRLIKLYCLSL